MRKVIGIALVLALAVMLMPSAVFAGEETTVDIKWGGGTFDSGGYPVNFGAGYIGATVTAGDDASTTFETGGNGILGSFTATDGNDKGAGYPVDTVNAYLDAEIQNGGYIEYNFNRTDDKYGAGKAGESSYAFVGTGTFNSLGFTYGTGTASMATGSNSNYERLQDFTYQKPLTPNDHNFEVNAASYTLIKRISDNVNQWAQVQGTGSGSANLDCAYSSANAGGASWQDATLSLSGSYSSGYHATATGPSYVEMYAQGPTSATLGNITTAVVVGGTGGGINWNSNPTWNSTHTSVTASGNAGGNWVKADQNFNTSFGINDFSASSLFDVP